MTIAVDLGRKATNKPTNKQKQMSAIETRQVSIVNTQKVYNNACYSTNGIYLKKKKTEKIDVTLM